MALNGLHPVQIGFPTRLPGAVTRGPPWRGHQTETDTHTHSRPQQPLTRRRSEGCKFLEKVFRDQPNTSFGAPTTART